MVTVQPQPSGSTPARPQPGARRFGKGSLAGLLGFVVVALLGLPSGLGGVLVLGGLYLMVTAIFHMIFGRSWASALVPASRKQAAQGFAGALVATVVGGILTPAPSEPAQAPAVASASASATATTASSPASRAAAPPASSPAVRASSSAARTTTAAAAPTKAQTTSATPMATTSKPTAAASSSTKRQPFVERASSPATTRRLEPTRTARAEPTRTRTQESSSSSDGDVVHPGSFCSVEGDTGVTSKGTTMECQVAKGGRLRWKKA